MPLSFRISLAYCDYVTGEGAFSTSRLDASWVADKLYPGMQCAFMSIDIHRSMAMKANVSRSGQVGRSR
jgi:hypothetical protein